MSFKSLKTIQFDLMPKLQTQEDIERLSSLTRTMFPVITSLIALRMYRQLVQNSPQPVYRFWEFRRTSKAHLFKAGCQWSLCGVHCMPNLLRQTDKEPCKICSNKALREDLEVLDYDQSFGASSDV